MGSEVGQVDPLSGRTLSIDDLASGMSAETRRVFSESDVAAFRALAPDPAPLHADREFARRQGYSDVVVFGFLVAAPFSGLLGNRLPGPRTVLHWVRFGLAAPVYVGDEIAYRAEVKQVSRSTGAIVLELTAARVATGEVVLRGQAQCGFRV